MRRSSSHHSLHPSLLRRTAALAFLFLPFVCLAETEEGPRYLAAASEIVASNVLVNAVDRFVIQGDWAQTSLSSMLHNLSSPWVFDHDDFSVNELGHPYNGSLYFAAGRSNGLGFWESAAGTVFGSATWELFGETELPSINDIVSTTMGGMVLGEIFHRVYDKLGQAPWPLRVMASPMDTLSDAVFRDGPEPLEASSRLAISLEAGMALPYLDMAEPRDLAVGRSEPMGLVAESLSYGDPLESSREPFSHFEQRLDLGFSASTYEASFFSNGSLCSFLLVDEPRWRLSLGASLHYDVIFSSLINLSANSVGLSLAAARRLPGDLSLSSEVHLNAVALGTNDNVFLREISAEAGEDSGIRNYDFGLGEGAKVYFLASQPRLGSLSLEYAFYGLHAIPAAEETDSGFEYALVGILKLSYEHKTMRHLALGFAYRLYHKDAFYDSFADVHESIQSMTLYAKIL